MTRHLGDTPPHGDFAHYVEELTRAPALHGGAPAVPQQRGAATPRRPDAGGVASLWPAVRWGVLLWVAWQIAAHFVYAPLALLSTPLLVVLIAWVVLRSVRRRGLPNLFSTPQWRDLMRPSDASRPRGPAPVPAPPAHKLMQMGRPSAQQQQRKK